MGTRGDRRGGRLEQCPKSPLSRTPHAYTVLVCLARRVVRRTVSDSAEARVASSTTVRWRAYVVAVTAVALGGCSAAPSSPAPIAGEVAAELVTPAGDTMHVVCAGSGSPAVVLVHGIGDRASSSNLVEVQRRLAEERRTCRFDRPGTGDSPSPSTPGRDGADLAAELGAVMNHADPNAPVLLVGHSFGSYPVLLAVDAFPGRVAGGVLLDAVDPGQGLLPALGKERWSEVAMAGEALDLEGVERDVRAAGDVGDLPWVVVRRSEGAARAWVDAQEALAGLSSRGTVRIADSGHDVPVDDPASVVDAVMEVEAAAR